MQRKEIIRAEINKLENRKNTEVLCVCMCVCVCVCVCLPGD